MDQLFGIVIVVLGVVGGIIWSEITKRRVLNTEKLSLLYELARTAVSAAETVGGSGENKLGLAVEGLVELAARIGVKLSEKEASVLIHGVLRQVTAPVVFDDPAYR